MGRGKRDHQQKFWYLIAIPAFKQNCTNRLKEAQRRKLSWAQLKSFAKTVYTGTKEYWQAPNETLLVNKPASRDQGSVWKARKYGYCNWLPEPLTALWRQLARAFKVAGVVKTEGPTGKTIKCSSKSNLLFWLSWTLTHLFNTLLYTARGKNLEITVSPSLEKRTTLLQLEAHLSLGLFTHSFQ